MLMLMLHMYDERGKTLWLVEHVIHFSSRSNHVCINVGIVRIAKKQQEMSRTSLGDMPENEIEIQNSLV